MAKYIDADILRKEIERRIDILGEVSVKQHKKGDPEMSTYYHGKAVSLEELLYFIDSLQQEQPSLPSDLDEAVEGEVCILPGGVAYVKEKNNDSLKQYILDNFKAGDKVKIIIVKGEEK